MEDWIQLDPAYDKPTSYIHHAFKISDYMEDLTRKAWQHLDKPYHFTEAQLVKIMQHALGEGQHQEVLDLHNRMPWDQKLDSIGELIHPYREHMLAGRAYDIHADMPPIQHYQMPPEMQPRNLSHFHQMKDEITKHLRDRNYSNQDIFQKLDEMFIDLGGMQNPSRGSRWSRWAGPPRSRPR